MEVVKVSKRLRRLKDNSKQRDDFDTMKQALERSGVVKKQRRVKHEPPADVSVTDKTVKHETPTKVATCVLTRPEKCYSFVTVGSKQYFMIDISIWGGVKPRVGDRFEVVVSEQDTRVIKARSLINNQ